MTVIQEVKDLALSKFLVNVPSPRRQRQVSFKQFIAAITGPMACHALMRM